MKSNHLKRLALAGAMLAASSSWATQEEFSIGTAAAPWLKLPKSARSAAMGDAFAAVADSVDTLGVNPAGLANFSDRQLSVNHDIWIQEISSDRVAYGQPIAGGGLGAAFDYVNFGSIPTYTLDAGGKPVAGAALNPMAMAITLGYAAKMAQISVGGSVKYLSEDLGAGASTAVAGDLGLLWSSDPKGASVGVALQNVGSQLNGYNLATNLKLGAAMLFDLSSSALRSKVEAAPADTFQAAIDVNLPTADGGSSSVNLGGEYWYQSVVAGRLGYRLANQGGLTGLVGFSAGVGFKLYQRIQLDYAYLALGELGNSNQISLLARF